MERKTKGKKEEKEKGRKNSYVQFCEHAVNELWAKVVACHPREQRMWQPSCQQPLQPLHPEGIWDGENQGTGPAQ